MTVQLSNLRATLLPEKALLIDDILVLADTHFGKSASFRARGVPIPEGDTARDSRRILDLFERHHPQRLVIAGDFLHARAGRTPEVLDALSDFFSQLACDTHLVLGNHDHRAGKLPAHWPVTIHESFDLDGLTIIHDPADAPAHRFAICAHLHPVARLRDGAATAFRTPCFWLRQHSLVLPSFGSFTGGSRVRPTNGDRLFAPLRNRVVEIPPEAL